MNKLEIKEHFELYMEMNPICECEDKFCFRPSCGKPHHLFSQTKLNRKLYPEYIDHYDNLEAMSNHCHANSKKHLSEVAFCNMFNIKPRSKSGKNKELRNG